MIPVLSRFPACEKEYSGCYRGRLRARKRRREDAGFAAISMVFALLYVHAWMHREQLGLNAVERLRTRHTLLDHLAMVLVGLTSAALAWTMPEWWVPVAGWFYFSIGVYYTIAETIYGNRERVLNEKIAAISPGVAESEK